MKEFSHFVSFFGNNALFLPIINIVIGMNDYPIRLILMKEAREFLLSLPIKVKEKIAFNYSKILNGYIDNEIFKKLDDSNIWEFRTLYNGNCYRLFAFWDTETGTLILATHGIVKKTQKTPAKEIAKAEEIRKRYFEAKRHGKN
jgi:phage-related protein